MRQLTMLMFLSFVCASCSNQELYNAGRGWQYTECGKIIETEERARCMEAANKSYDQYEKEKEELKDE